MAELPDEGLNGEDAVERSSTIEAGSYNVQVINSNRQDNEETGVVALNLQFQVLDGPKEKQTFWLRFNYVNPNSSQNQDIARDHLRLIAKAAGIGLFKDTEALHNQPFNITVNAKQSKPDSDGNTYINNNLTNARPYQNGGGSPAPKQQAKPAGAKSPEPKAEAKAGGEAKSGGAPWKNKAK